MNVGQLRGWLLQQPKASIIRVTIDGEVEELKPGKSWAKTAETIVALEPELVQALDAGGKLLRATRFEADAAPRRKTSEAPTLPEVIAQDPNAAMLTHFASLIHRAYEHSTLIAFEKMIELVDSMGHRSESIEQRLERTEARARRLQDEQVDDAYDRAEEIALAAQQGGSDDALKSQLLGSFLNGQLQRSATKTNGAAAPSKANGS